MQFFFAACNSRADKVLGADESKSAIAAVSGEAAFLSNSDGALHNSAMDRVFARLGGRRHADPAARCRAVFDGLTSLQAGAPGSIRTAITEYLFRSSAGIDHRGRAGSVRVHSPATHECETWVADDLLALATTDSELPCAGNCGGEVGDPSQQTYAISAAALSVSQQIVRAAVSSPSMASLDATLTNLMATTASVFNVAEREMLATHASLVRGSYLASLDAEADMDGTCSDQQKKAKGRTIRDADATAFVGAIGSALGISALGTALAWKAVFTGAVAGAGAVSAYVTVVEVTTPCS